MKLINYLIFFNLLIQLIYLQDYDDFDTANEMDELDKFFDISTKSPPKELNGSANVVSNIIILFVF